MKIEELYNIYKNSVRINTDTRTVRQGDLFFALKGEKFNANEFATEALAKGANYVIIDEEKYAVDNRCILVPSVLETLQQLARYHRLQFKIPIIAIAGSNGKTTTKELIYAVLSTTYKTHYTAGNFNNHIGLPITLLNMPADTEMGVIEMGANHLKETYQLCEIAEPNYGVVTNNGKDHLSGFGSLEGVKQANSELYEWLRTVKGTVFVNGVDTDLMQASKDLNQIIYGQHKLNNCTGEIVKANPLLSIKLELAGEFKIIQTNLAGAYNLDNILCAACIGQYFKVPSEKIALAISSYQPANNRSQVKAWLGNTFIVDCYNANPSSMKLALESFEQIESDKKMVILGDMLELGEYSYQEHLQIATLLTSLNIQKVILIGSEFALVKSTIDCEWFYNISDAQKWFASQSFHDWHILLKGSRGIALEKLIYPK